MINESANAAGDPPLWQVHSTDRRAIVFFKLGEEMRESALSYRRERKMLRHPHDANTLEAHFRQG
jgi:hypothetical protein